ncbi:MAG: 4-hydroxy-tetrahydrodipicolinate synthase [bacterium]
MTQTIGRLITALVTPFTDDGLKIDHGRVERLVAHVVAGGSDGLLVGGTTGEGPTLSESEFFALLRTVKACAPPEIGVMANVGTNSTAASIERAKQAAAFGINSLLVVCPYYNKPPQAGLIAHYEAVSRATPLPIMIYNIPGRTAVNMLPETVAAVIEGCPTVVAIKEASGDLAQMERVIELCPKAPRFELWSGDDGLLAEVMALGGVGVVSVLSHIAGPALNEIIDAAYDGDWKTARSRQAALKPLVEAAFCTTNPIGIKTMLNLSGVAVGPCRLPLCPPSPAELKKIKAALAGVTEKPAIR